MVEKIKDTLVGVGIYSIFILGAVGYVNCIIWMFDNWSSMQWLSKAAHIIGITFLPPLGIILGIVHLF